jgi:hypothetical protein
MSSQDDPEARIRDLERSPRAQPTELTLASSEVQSTPFSPPPAYAAPPVPCPAPYPPLPYPPTRTTPAAGSSRPWIVFAVIAAALVAVIGGTAALFASVYSSVDATGSGGSFGVSPSFGGQNRPPAPTFAPKPPGDVSVSGVGGHRTIACHDGTVSISGVDNTVVLTGQCRSVTVSGVQNNVTVETADTISASGFNNRVTYASGTPHVDNSGDSNVVAKS